LEHELDTLKMRAQQSSTNLLALSESQSAAPSTADDAAALVDPDSLKFFSGRDNRPKDSKSVSARNDK
jgi:hypothetical protein